MDRGSAPLKAHLEGCEQFDMRQTRRGCLQEIMGCEARTEFKYFIGETQIAHSLEESDCCCRIFCQQMYPYKVEVKELNTDAELFTAERPMNCPVNSCKCCLYQKMTVSSGGQELGTIKENCWYCVPEFTAVDHDGKEIYIIRPPVCCGGMCVNCCAEGNPCGKGCMKSSFEIYNPEGYGNDAEPLGKILQKPKSLMTELFTDAQAFDVKYPSDANVAQKGLLAGATLLMNSLFYEGSQSEG